MFLQRLGIAKVFFGLRSQKCGRSLAPLSCFRIGDDGSIRE